MCALMRSSSFWNHVTGSPAFGTLFCLKPRGVTIIHGRSPTSDQATRVALPPAMLGPIGLDEAGLGPMNSRCACMSPM